MVNILKYEDVRLGKSFSEVKGVIKSICYKYYKNFKAHKVFSPIISKEDILELKKLAKDKEIIVCKPDKGNGVVIMDRDPYLRKMKEIISDRSKFREIKDNIFNYTLAIEGKINRFLLKLKKDSKICENVYSSLTVSGSGPGILYGLPKIHKPNFSQSFPMRPIFAAYRTPSFPIAKYLVPILNPFTSNEYTVANSYKFVEEISKMKDSKDLFMASFDVESLFTNIPLNETIEIAIEHLFKNQSYVKGMDKKEFRKLLELSVKNSYFLFDGKHYEQVEGLGMGLPLGPTFANLFLCYHEEKWLENCPNSYKPAYYRRYIDDTFLLFKKQDHVKSFLEYLNSQHPNIKFTCEEESDCSLSFLDVSVKKINNIFETSVFRKATFFGLGTSYFSFCSSRFKSNILSTLISRAYKVCSTYKNLDIEFKFLKNFFIENGFPLSMINSSIRRYLNNSTVCSVTKELIPTCSKKNVYVSLPYFGLQSEEMKTELRNSLTKFYPHISFHFVMMNKRTIGSLFNYKDKLPKELLSSIVYKFSCAHCNSASYIGSSIRTLKVRVAEHAGLSFRTNLPLSRPSASSIRDHTDECGYFPRISDFEVLATTNNRMDLRILESLHIGQLTPSLNGTEFAYPLYIATN